MSNKVFQQNLDDKKGIQTKIASGRSRLEVSSGITCAKGGSKSSTLSMMMFFR